MRRPVDLILPDTGPLITLALADRLDLLTTFERPVLIPDVVREEALAKPGGLGHDKLEEWFGRTGHNQHQIIPTPFMATYRTLRASDGAGGRTNPTRGMGEATMMWVLANVERLHGPGTICLVLTEDGRAGDAFPDDVHVLSTRSWLQGLQNLGVIEDAFALIADVERAGRTPSRYSRDRRGTDVSGNRTEWVNQVNASVDSKQAGKAMPRTGTGELARAFTKPADRPQAVVDLLVTLDEVTGAISLIDDGEAAPWGERIGSPASELLSSAGHGLTVGTEETGHPTKRGVMALAFLQQSFGRQAHRKVTIDPVVATQGASPAGKKRFEELLSTCLATTRDRQRKVQ